ncbi:MAG: transposase [Syntrophales bacterium]|nr:transposase [Syntrophales bacterium]
MPNYLRSFIPGGTFFFTLVTYERRRWLCTEEARQALNGAIKAVRETRPFIIDAVVLLPDHLHCIWTLPDGDHDFSTRWRLMKSFVTKRCKSIPSTLPGTASRIKRKEQNLWQRRFWEHTIRDERDFAAHCDYIHYNPVKHGLCESPAEWPYSSFSRYLASGLYEENWGRSQEPQINADVGRE